MTFPPTSGKFGLAQTQSSVASAQIASLVQSGETGDFAPDSRLKDGTIATRKDPVEKPWAHFVAGG